ncbi:MAG TPA: hypothetical protein VKT72_12170, partial [Candidatus Baltobacteraceae bacterium]|nr:hypothetical protein [Candidatus Baltobacteraceae bacterium]
MILAPLLLASTITIDGNSPGRTFDGIGAISGGGGTSRLLIDYPRKERSEILDYLFKPHFGANLQILKVEIGSDANSTNGAEASSMRSPSDANYNRGYEWWMMEQAKARNPRMKLAGLEWGAPGWFRLDTNSPDGFFSNDNIHYLVDWIEHAWSDHHLHIDYIGGWNESNGWAPYDRYNLWYATLKAALLRNHLDTKLIAYDASGENWDIARGMDDNSALRSAVDVMGVHYPCGNDGGPALKCDRNAVAIAIGKPIWASENGSQNWDKGADALARAINRGYIDGRMTAFINWSAVGSWYRTLPDWGDALMQADQPWSGHYYVAKSIWVMAHTGQFAAPGWRYLNSACGYLGGDRNNGSYVTLEAPNKRDYSIVLETTTAKTPQTAEFSVTGGLSAGTLHVWATNLHSAKYSDWFVQFPDVTPRAGHFSLALRPGYMYSITTTSGQHKGASDPPPAKELALPYRDNFDEYRTGALPKYFAAAQGAFEAAPCTLRSGMCMRQQINLAPIEWPIGSPTGPIVITGDPSWTNYTVRVDAMLEQPGAIEVIGRYQGLDQFDFGGSQGYHLRLTSDGRWALLSERMNGINATLASGRTAFGVRKWHTLALRLDGASIVAYVDSKRIASARDATYRWGNVGILVGGWQNAQFDDFA